MAFVPGYKYDIFVSYALVDDEPLSGAKEGWVTTLIKNLKTHLDQKLGSTDAYSLQSIHHLPGNVQMTAEIMKILRKTATFIVILSPAYLKLDWCQRQTDSFLNMVKDRVRAGSRVFVVERDRLDDEDQPSEFRDLRGYRFWVAEREGKPPRILGEPEPLPEDRQYYDELHDLAYELVEELKQLQGSIDSVDEDTSPEPDICATVLLAEVTDDLYFQREQVKRYLEQFNVTVLPKALYSCDPEAFQEAVRGDLARSDVFVQLLSDVPFKAFPDLPQGYVRCQYELAQKAGIEILQWRAPELEVNTVNDPAQCNFLQLETVMAMGIEEFKAEIVKRVKTTSSQETPPIALKNENTLIFVNSNKHDSNLSNEICQTLETFGITTVEPWREGDPEENRKYSELYMLNSEAIILVYGNVLPSWVVAMQLEMRKILPLRETPPALAIYEGPPPELKSPLPYKLPETRIIDCRTRLDIQKLRDFIDFIQTKETAL